MILILNFSFLFSDEGMWTFDNPPVKHLKKRHNFTPSQEWLDHVRLSSVRFMDGGSGSFVSSNGLVMTNHHIAVGQLQKISTSKKDYVKDGFYALSQKEERKCPDLEINVVVSMEKVTEKVLSAIKKNMDEAEALKARKARIAKIEKENLDKTGLRSNVVSLYHGGEYWLYQYKKYTDVRLVFAPERQAAYFGGDWDNFTYPRYDLDAAFFRVYENDKPIKPKHYFKWNSKGAAENELVFVTGNPGNTDRLLTHTQLTFHRDILYPMLLKNTDKQIEMLHQYIKKGPEQKRRGIVRLFYVENSKKARTGILQGLRDKTLLATHKKKEKGLRKKVSENKQWKEEYSDAWDIIDSIVEIEKKIVKERFYSHLRGSDLEWFAQTIVRYVTEVTKPDADRLDGYHESDLEELRFNLFSPAPIYRDREETLLAGNLQISLDELVAKHEFIILALGSSTSDKIAKKVITGTKLDNVDFRKKLIKGEEKAVKKSKDPLIVYARKLDPYLRKIEKWHRDNIESVITPASEKIAKARFIVYGKSVYPDATFTLRLTYGSATGYSMNGTKAPYKTTLYGLFDRAISFDKKEDFWLPKRFWDNKDKLDLSTPVNFVSSCDVVGGNSGSPVINKNAEIVGLIFDGNIESLTGKFIFDTEKNRAVAVHSAYIIEALRKLYNFNYLADEIEGK